MRLALPAARRLIAGMGLLVCAGAGADGTGPQQLQAFLDGLQALRADFEQTVADTSGDDLQRSRGSLALLRPGRFRWDYREPYPQQIVADGDTVWIYDPELEQVTRQDQADALRGSPAQVLSGTAPVEAGFEVREGAATDEPDLAWAVLTPKDEASQFEEIRLGFRDGALARMEMADKLGRISLFRFHDLQRNPDLGSGVFRFEVPAGVDVLRR